MAISVPASANPPVSVRTRFRAPVSVAFLLRRLGSAAVAVIAVLSVVFFSLHLTGNPAVLLLPPDAPPEELARLTALMGFDRPLPEQYLSFLVQAGTGNFPESIRYGQPAMDLVALRFPATLTLGLTGLGAGSALGLVIGYKSAVSRGNGRTLPVTVLTALESIPSFFLGILLILLFSITLRWFPLSGGGSLAHLVLPSLVIALAIAAPVARIFRATLLETLGRDHVVLARAKGIGQHQLAVRHVVLNSLPPVLNTIGIQAGVALGGAVVTETLFAWPGVGQLAVSALNGRDYPLVLASVTVIAVGFVLVNLAVDIAVAVFDPRAKDRI
ncbi:MULTISPECIES: ABC transporter permease [unclassified Pseudarthrobacter]|uniref:ABC transporter permease n=1 Tax=unclassified Pseudarthrobacter TaxID=2647000 RepID=UPI00362BC57B